MSDFGARLIHMNTATKTSGCTVQVLDDNESITLRVSTTVGESLIVGVDTMGEASADEPIRLECTVYTTHEGHSRVRFTALVLGQSLRDVLVDRPATWTACGDLSSQVEDAIERLVPGARNGRFEAEVQVESEADTDGDEELVEALNARPANVSWFSLPGAVRP